MSLLLHLYVAFTSSPDGRQIKGLCTICATEVFVAVSAASHLVGKYVTDKPFDDHQDYFRHDRVTMHAIEIEQQQLCE